MRDIFKAHAVQIVLVFFVFLIFITNGAGLLEIHFNLRSGLSLRSFLFNPASGQFAWPGLLLSPVFLLLLVTGIVLSLLLPILTPIQASLLTALAAMPQFYLAYTGTAHPLLPMEYCLLTILMLYAINVLISYFRETVLRQRIVDVFGQYVPPQLVSEISKEPERLKMECESRYLTVFFCDLKNFTGVAEQLNPKQLARLLNEYFTVMTGILYEHGATIDKYIGDSIMAFWGAPLPQKDHAKRAVLSSLDMQQEIPRLMETFRRRGWPGPSMGIGINSGMMSVGNMGSRYRVAYTVVGDAVNLASRLESLTRRYQVPTIVSDATRKDADGILYRALDLVQVRGKHNMTRIYQPVCRENEADEALRRKLEEHQRAMEYYFAEDWPGAAKAVDKLKQEYSDDPLYPAVLDRIRDKMARN